MKNKKAILAVYFFLLVMLMICGQNLLEVLTSVVGAIFLVILNRRSKSKYFNGLFIKWKKIKELEFYKISDYDKKGDLEERKKICQSFSSSIIYFVFILLMDCICIKILISRYFKSNNFFSSILFVIVVIAFIILFSGHIISFSNSHIVWTYLLVPGLGYVISYIIIEIMGDYSFVENNQNFLLAIGTIVASITLYFLLVIFFPPYVLKKLSNKTAIISVCLTLLTFMSTQFLIPYVIGQSSGQFITSETIKGMKDTSDGLRKMLINNPGLIEILNYALTSEEHSSAATQISILLTPIAIAYTFGGIMIDWKINKSRKKAISFFRSIVLNDELCNYSYIIKCAFYGGEEYENLLLSNEKTRSIIVSNEKKFSS